MENNSETYGNYVTGFPNDNMDNLLFGKKYNEKVTGDERTTRSIDVYKRQIPNTIFMETTSIIWE